MNSSFHSPDVLFPFAKFFIRSGFKVRMERKRTVYIYTYFLPCSLMVMVSWVGFAVRADAVPGRWFSSTHSLPLTCTHIAQAWPSAHPPPDDDQPEQQRDQQHPHLRPHLSPHPLDPDECCFCHFCTRRIFCHLSSAQVWK